MADRLWTFGDAIFSRENKPFKLFFQGQLAKWEKNPEDFEEDYFW